jgi:acetyl-CoA carboxylase biotin carboxyl carrier protein
VCVDVGGGVLAWQFGNAFSGLRAAFSRSQRCRVRAMAVQVLAHITGTVWKIEAKVGDSVSAEQTLVILESMKMEMPVEAPEAGRVSSIAVSEGQSVEEGDLLLELE